MAEEGLRRTDNKLIHIGSPIPFDVEHFLDEMERLMDAAYRNDPDIREIVREIVLTYQPAEKAEAVREKEAVRV